MDTHDLTRKLNTKNNSKIVLLVADGLGGLPHEVGGQTELEAANTPNLDALATRGVQGLSHPVLPGISPGSGPGHLGLFGYDPLKYQIGRGALEATGIGFELRRDDINSFLPDYLSQEILPVDPFQSLDTTGVGQLVEMGVTKGRATKPNLKIGICGEHGGDPASIKFCDRIGLNYVSCSPFRVPVARLAAAQAALSR
jgi:hypothetical protein